MGLVDTDFLLGFVNLFWGTIKLFDMHMLLNLSLVCLGLVMVGVGALWCGWLAIDCMFAGMGLVGFEYLLLFLICFGEC